MDLGLKGLRAIVTGGTKGIGRRAADMLADEERSHQGGEAPALVTYQPIGVVYSIQPWNFPIYQPVRVLAAALMAGNGCVLKHASICTGIALRLRENSVLIEPGEVFFGPDGGDRSHYRLAYSSIPAARIPEGIRLIAAALADAGPK